MVDDMISDDGQRELLLDVSRRVPAIAHGVGLSVGTATPPDSAYLDRVAEVVQAIRARWYSEHLSFTKVPHRDAGQLLPLPRTPEAAQIVAHNIEVVRRHIRLPIALENISYYFDYPSSSLSEAEFIRLVLEHSGCFLLLDLENLYLNSTNHGYDPYQFLDSLPTGCVKGVHVAGGTVRDGLLIDTHDQPVPDRVFELLAYLLDRQNPDSIILERDQNLDRVDEVFQDVTRLRETITRSRNVRRVD